MQPPRPLAASEASCSLPLMNDAWTSFFWRDAPAGLPEHSANPLAPSLNTRSRSRCEQRAEGKAGRKQQRTQLNWISLPGVLRAVAGAAGCCLAALRLVMAAPHCAVRSQGDALVRARRGMLLFEPNTCGCVFRVHCTPTTSNRNGTITSITTTKTTKAMTIITIVIVALPHAIGGWPSRLPGATLGSLGAFPS